MIYAMLVLGLLPALLLPDFAGGAEEEEGPVPDPASRPDEAVDLLDDPVYLDDPDGPPLLPVIGDDQTLGEPSVEVPLAPVVEADQDHEDALYPVIEDDLGPVPPFDDDDAFLFPLIEDDPAPTGPIVDDTDILLPVIEDDVAGSDRDGAPLIPVIEDDIAGDPVDDARLALAEDESMLLASEAWLDDADLATGSHAEISGFEAGADRLRITLDPDHQLSDLTVSVDLADNGVDSEVWIGDTLFAALRDAPDVSAEDVILLVRPPG